ncbi:MerR family transcriptional regulator [Streptomyces sp. DSM 41014]|uniref:MerR family transcriptional regulator n=1 Tax=Streptomyces hintoniae TaxID=3075521 RepID=A0ABU2UKN0_9ACTN|nr:MerR family transcriptional regulator [Streptomyces sp. DSM 41014]MDT0473810.1 MerR family transcriptional regulator [Streptomyces sp. DSM 41014]
MRIGELSRRTDVAVYLLRYYEEQGLLHPQRGAGGYREYVEEEPAIVRRIRSLLAAGLGTSTISTVLPCLRDTGDRLVPTCSDLLADLHQERDRIAQVISDLQASMNALDDVIAAAPADVTRRALASLDM